MPLLSGGAWPPAHVIHSDVDCRFHGLKVTFADLKLFSLLDDLISLFVVDLLVG